MTRQTISKWELGQTTPEMDKLVEMSKLFNLSVDELINESVATPNQPSNREDQPMKKESAKNNKKTVVIVAGILIVLIILFIVIGIVLDTGKNSILDKFFSMFEKTTEIQENRTTTILDKATNIIDQVTEDQQKGSDDMADEFSNALDKITNAIDLQNGK